jgi:hypothetical protein
MTEDNNKYMDHESKQEEIKSMSHESHNHEDHQEKMNDEWHKGEKNPTITALDGGKSMAEIYEADQAGAQPEIQHAFHNLTPTLGCSDGRKFEPRLARPGTGILAGVQATADAIDELITSGEIKDKLEITDHKGCGAAKAVCDQLIIAGQPAPKDPDELGKKFADDLAAEMKLRHPELKVIRRHVGADKMEEFHTERVIYFDGTKKIHHRATAKLPAGFTFTNLKMSDETTIKELKALCNIAFDEKHGFGKRFTSVHPFRIIVSARNKAELDEQLALARKVAAGYDYRVAVDGFIIG